MSNLVKALFPESRFTNLFAILGLLFFIIVIAGLTLLISSGIAMNAPVVEAATTTIQTIDMDVYRETIKLYKSGML